MPVVYDVVISTNSQFKQGMMAALGHGAQKAGYKVDFVINPEKFFSIKNFDNDFCCIFGWCKGLPSDFRWQVINHFTSHGGDIKRACFFEGNVLRAKESGPYIKEPNGGLESYNYYRFPFKSIISSESLFRGYHKLNLDNKINDILNNSKIKVKDWKQNKKYIIIYTNRGVGGWSHMGRDTKKWLLETITTIKKHTDRPIIVKQHQSTHDLYEQRWSVIDKFPELQNSFYMKNLPKEIYDNAHCAVILSSTVGAVTLVDGIPTFVDLDTAFVSPWSAGELKDIESPNLNVDRNDFLKLYAKCHWSVEEMKNGTMWKGIMEEEQS
jgi:hypothetical protein